MCELLLSKVMKFRSLPQAYAAWARAVAAFGGRAAQTCVMNPLPPGRDLYRHIRDCNRAVLEAFYREVEEAVERGEDPPAVAPAEVVSVGLDRDPRWGYIQYGTGRTVARLTVTYGNTFTVEIFGPEGSEESVEKRYLAAGGVEHSHL